MKKILKQKLKHAYYKSKIEKLYNKNSHQLTNLHIKEIEKYIL